ncbi:MAG: kelch repeat-containing protein [Fluviicola sp.]
MRLLITILICAGSYTTIAQGAWTTKDSVNGQPRSVASSFVLNGEGYVLGGLDHDGFRRKMYSYDFWTDDWDDELSIGGLSGDGLERGSACAFAVNNKGYICLGQGETNPFFGDMWEYDPSTETWSQKANFIGTPRRQAVCFVLDDMAYIGTGIDANGLQKDMYRYDPSTNIWTPLNDFGGSARKEAVGFSMGDQGYVGTGDDGVMLSDFWQYEPTTDTWTQKTDFPGTPRKGAVGWGQFPSGFICMGEDLNFQYRRDLWEYNYYADAWVQRADYPGPGRSNATCFILNNFAFVGTGFNGSFEDDMYAYLRILNVDEIPDMNVSVYPNPAVDGITVESDYDDFDLHIVSLDGKTTVTSSNIVKTATGYRVDRGNLPSGTYLAYFTRKHTGEIHVEKIQFI